MANDLIAFEKQLMTMAPRFSQVLGATMPEERLIQTLVVSCERLPKLLECERQSLFQGAMTFACLALEVDGATGQGYLIPFKSKAQPVIGYKGFNTLAGRSGFAVNAACVYENDEFEYDVASGLIRHKPALSNRGRMIAAWSRATSLSLPPIGPIVLGIDDLLAVKAKSPGAKRSDSPWNDEAIGFPAMCEKTAKRRLARGMPLNLMQPAARMDEAHEEQGLHSWIDPDKGVIIDGEVASPLPERHTDQPDLTSAAPAPWAFLLADGSQKAFATPELWVGFCKQGLAALTDGAKITAMWERNAATTTRLSAECEDLHAETVASLSRRLGEVL